MGRRGRLVDFAVVAQGAAGELSSCQGADRRSDQGRAAKFTGKMLGVIYASPSSPPTTHSTWPVAIVNPFWPLCQSLFYCTAHTTPAYRCLLGSALWSCTIYSSASGPSPAFSPYRDCAVHHTPPRSLHPPLACSRLPLNVFLPRARPLRE